jgi:putative inorganic carbon (HCO3(-)) transporter
MRDIFIFGIVVAGCLMALGRPWIGVIMWTWVSVMNPHTQAWGWVQTMPVALMVAVSTLLGFLMTRDRQSPFIDPAVICLVLFMIWICIGWPMSYYVEESREMLTRVLKIDFMIIVTIALLLTRKQIELFVWVMTFSVAFYGVKAGIFTLATGGVYKVWGPGGFIGGNNEVALAIIIVIPFIYYGYQVAGAERRWLRRALMVSMGLCAAAALGTHSRGALLAIAGMSAFLWWRSDKKLLVGIVLVVLGVALIAFMPSNWMDRMQTIETYDQDASAMGRINAWWMAFHLANDHLITGGGFSVYSSMIFEKYAPNPADVHAAHSIYFQILGEHGWMGLILWMSIWWFTWRSAAWMRRNAREADGTLWCGQLASMCQVSMIGYAVGGAFLSLAYFDVPYDVMAIVVTTKKWMQARAGQQTAASPVAIERGVPA